jgi:hypothetical protein
VLLLAIVTSLTVYKEEIFARAAGITRRLSDGSFFTFNSYL